MRDRDTDKMEGFKYPENLAGLLCTRPHTMHDQSTSDSNAYATGDVSRPNSIPRDYSSLVGSLILT